METPRRIIIRTAWCLAKSYWTSEEKRSAWNLLVAVIVLNLGNVFIGVRINEWNRAFYDALQTFNAMALFRQVGIFGILVAFAVLASVSALYLNQLLQIRWRRWLTKRYLAAWLADRAYYKLQLGSAADNPDQRIAEDLHQFTGYILTLSLGLISSIVSLFSFLTILWGLSGAANIPLGALGTAHIPGYLVWSALIYAGLGTWLAVTIGRPLVALNSARQRYEADFRFSLVHLREHAESVALYGGEPVELGLFYERMQNVFANFRQITGLRNATLELAIMVQPIGEQAAGIEFELLRTYPLCVAVTSAHPLARLKSVPLEKVAAEPLIGLRCRDFPEYYRNLNRIFAPIGAKPHIAVECDSGNSLLIEVEAGRGIALSIPVFKLVTGKRLLYRPITGKTELVPIGIARATKGDITPAGEKFCAILRKTSDGATTAKAKPGRSSEIGSTRKCPSGETTMAQGSVRP